MGKQKLVVSGSEHKIVDLSISLISLSSFILYFLFPHMVFASAVAKNKAISFDFSSTIKPYSFVTNPINGGLKIAKDSKTQLLLPIETGTKVVNYKVAAVAAANSQGETKVKTAPASKPVAKQADSEGMDFAEYITKDKYVNPEKEAMLLAGQGKVVSRRLVTLSAYSSTPDQTDSSPFITASGTHVRDGIVATNILPFGTKIKIPAIYGNKIFTVEDRMHTRFQNNVDIWFTTRQAAKSFGIKRAEIEIVVVQ